MVRDAAKRSLYRRSWHNLFKEKTATTLNLDFGKPKRFGNGRHMTTNTFSDYIKSQDGLVDIKGTLVTLRAANEILTFEMIIPHIHIHNVSGTYHTILNTCPNIMSSQFRKVFSKFPGRNCIISSY